MDKIASFQINHLLLNPGIYVSRKDKAGDQILTTFDIRMTKPNYEPVMNTAEVHTIEHLGATFLRNNEEYKDRVIYFGPMGCRTGFYLILAGDYESKDIVELMISMFEFIRHYHDPIPGANPRECAVWSNDYLRELWDENAKYLKSIRESKNGYGFDDIGMGAAYAYSTMYQKIVEGYRNGTREVYVCDNPESGKRRLLSMDEELEKLNKGFEELIKWDKMVAKSQKQNAENKQKFQNTKLDESFDAFDINQACDYIQDSYLEFRSLYLEQYERTGGNIDIKSLFSSVLRSGNQDMHKYCEFLFEKIGFIV